MVLIQARWWKLMPNPVMARLPSGLRPVGGQQFQLRDGRGGVAGAYSLLLGGDERGGALADR
jgi:hypothetical protein